MDEIQLVKISVAIAISLGIAKNQEEIGQKMGYQNKSSFSQVINGKAPISSKFIESLKSLDPRIKRFWETGVVFVKGDGSYDIEAMAKSLPHMSEPRSQYQVKDTYDRLLKEKDLRIQDKESIIKDKEEIIGLLKTQLDLKSTTTTGSERSNTRTI